MILEGERHSEFVLLIGSKGTGKTSTIKRCLNLAKPNRKTKIKPGVRIECKYFPYQEKPVTFLEIAGNFL